MTPREPDRFDKQARDLMDSECPHEREDYDEIPCVLCLADFLRAAESSALERAAQIADRYKSGVAILIADSIRASKEPAAAPAADYDPIAAPIPAGDMNGPHGSLPAAETGKAQGADLLAALQIACWAMCGKNGPEHIVACSTIRTALRGGPIPAPAQGAEARKAQAWAAAIEYCEEMFSPEWLADRRNRSIFAAHIYRLLNAARAAQTEGEGNR